MSSITGSCTGNFSLDPDNGRAFGDADAMEFDVSSIDFDAETLEEKLTRRSCDWGPSVSISLLSTRDSWELDTGSRGRGWNRLLTRDSSLLHIDVSNYRKLLGFN